MTDQLTGQSTDQLTDRSSERSTDQPDHRPAPDAAALTGPVPAAAPVTVADVEEAMLDVVDPELGINVVDLGLVYGVTIDTGSGAGTTAVLDMTLTSAACPLTDVIEDQTREALTGVVDDYRVNWVWMPPWGPEKITPSGREQLRSIGFNL